MKYDLVRDGYAFRETFDAGLDKETCQCDIEGVDVYDFNNDELIGHVDWVVPSKIEDMDDEEFYDFLDENNIYL